MANYKPTLNLPQTEFPMKANLAQREPALLTQWAAMDLYGQMQAQAEGRPRYILHDGPPYANGQIHIGHAVNKILKDIVIKSRQQSGYAAPYVPGWDCHGLPIELNVEKKVGKPGRKLTHEAFRQECRRYAEKQVNLQRESFKRLGVLGEWEKPYLTMNFSFEANMIRALGRIIANGHVQQGHKPVHWCLDCRSALAEAEVEYADKTSDSIDVRFPVVDEATCLQQAGFDAAGQGPMSFVIWTTTPWTLPANQAVSVHPELTYCLVQLPNERLWFAEALVEKSLARYGFEDFTILGHCQGEALAKLDLQHPFYDRTVPILLGDHVTTEDGTGAVHTAPAHGREDYQVCLANNIACDNPVMGNGCFRDDLPIFGGQSITKSNPPIIELLQEKNRLLSHTKIEHSYPHCWRHKTPLIFRATPQWFISMEKNGLREQALAAIRRTQWIPSWGQARIEAMIEHHPDWCISRQRTWGVPMCLFLHKQTGDLHPDMPALMEKIAERMDEQGIEAWHQLELQEFLGEEADDYTKSQDTLDVWFDSGVTHFCVLEQREGLQVPADLYLEGSDQHRGWFQSSLLTSVALRGEPPYQAVLTHGFTVDADGRKMSKSLGNVVAPDQVTKTLGADVLRLWVANTDFRGELNVSDEIMKRNSDVYRRLRNTARFLLANTFDFDPEQHSVEPENMLALDRWVVARASQIQKEIIADYHNHDFHHICQRAHHFCSVELGGFYLDVVKDRQYTTQPNNRLRRSAQTAMYQVLEALVRWLAPVLSFTADEVWEYMPGKREASVHLATWFEGLTDLPEDASLTLESWQQLLQLREAVNKSLEAQRKAGNIGSSLAADVLLFVDEQYQKLLSHLGDELRFLLITSTAQVKPLSEAKDAEDTECEGLKLQVKASSAQKCVRCWHYTDDVGQHPEHPEICGRCVENIEGEGEHREWI